MDISNLGKILIVVGGLIVLVGGLLLLAGRFGIQLGRLPGDIRIQTENMTCVFPLATSILLSLLLTVGLNLLVRLLRK
jgi:hypothetical protein